MLEIDRLDAMLKEARIPFKRIDKDLRPEHDYWKYHIYYPKRPKVGCGSYQMVCSVIQGTCTYGGNENLLEIMGLLTPEEAECDSVRGYLTAENVFERIKKHWEANK
ncbi:MAG: hypothetical protein IKK97_02615 [Phascolarctobacterium sp.]|nr:hypothetical protein [Phascolarctobacterium sp.]